MLLILVRTANGRLFPHSLGVESQLGGERLTGLEDQRDNPSLFKPFVRKPA